MLKSYIQKLMARENLTKAQCAIALNEILNSDNSAQIAAFLVLLHAKSETAEELLAMIEVLRNEMTRVEGVSDAIDIVGTGGDGANTVNISTAASILTASCGVKVVKHSNRSVSSSCGSIDVLEQLGIKIHMEANEISKLVRRANIGFCYAPSFHPALNKLKNVRQRLAVRTTFNLLGPFLNPASVKYALIGVCDKKYLQIFSAVIQKLELDRAMIVHSCGLDELSLLGPADVIEVNSGKIKQYTLDPKSFGFNYCTLEQLQGGDAKENARKILQVFKGEKSALADSIVFNAGVALYIIGKVQSVVEGITLAENSLYQGMAMHKLQQLREPCYA